MPHVPEGAREQTRIASLIPSAVTKNRVHPVKQFSRLPHTMGSCSQIRFNVAEHDKMFSRMTPTASSIPGILTDLIILYRLYICIFLLINILQKFTKICKNPKDAGEMQEPSRLPPGYIKAILQHRGRHCTDPLPRLLPLYWILPHKLREVL
jgi:hypothetical protein